MSHRRRHGICMPSNTLGALNDVAPAPAAPTLGALDDVQVTKPTAAGTPGAAATPAAPSSGTQQLQSFGQPPKAHYLLSLLSETSSVTSDEAAGNPISPWPLPALTLPMLPAAANSESSQSEQGLFGTPRSRVSDSCSMYSLGSAGEFSQDGSGAAGTQAQLLQQQCSSSPLCTVNSAHTGSLSGSSAGGENVSHVRTRFDKRAPPTPVEMVAAGVTGTSIPLSLPPQQQQQAPLAPTLQTQKPTQQQTEQLWQQQQQSQLSPSESALATLEDAHAPVEPLKVSTLLAPRKGVSNPGAAPSTVMAGSAAAAIVAAAVAATKVPRKGAADAPASYPDDPIPRVVVEGSLGASFESGTATPVDSSSTGGSSTTASTVSTSLRSSSGGGGSPRAAPNSGSAAAAESALAAAAAAPAAGASSRRSSGGGRRGVRMPAEAATEAGSSRKQQQQSAMAALTADIIAAAASGAAAGAALAAIAEVGEDQQKKQPQSMTEKVASTRMKQHFSLKAQGSSSPRGSPTAAAAAGAVSPAGSASSSPNIGITLVDPAAAAAAAASARRRSQSSRSGATSAAGGKGTDRNIAAQADIEQPAAVVMTSRGSITQPQKRHSSGGVGKSAALAGSLTAMLGVAAAKLTPKKGLSPTPPPSDSAPASRPSSAAGDDKKEAATAEQPPSKRNKYMTWGLLSAGLLTLLIVVAVAIAVPVSKQNAAKRSAAAHTTGFKGPRGAPLNFKVDVQVPPDSKPEAGPVCAALFGASGEKMVEGYLGVFRRTLANKLQVKSNEIAVNSVTCNNNTPVMGAAGIPAALGGTLPRPAHKRMLLQEDSESWDSFETSPGSNMRAAAPNNSPATLATVFHVPAPADPAERAQLAANIKQGTPSILTGPLSEFFGKPVTVLPPQQLQEPARKPAPLAEAPRKPRGLPLVPSPSLEPPPTAQVIETEIADEVPVEVITEIPGRNSTAPVTRPQLSPKPKAGPQDDTEDSEETPTLPPQLLKAVPKVPKANAMKPQGPLPANKTLPSFSPAPVKLVLWANTPQCKGKPDGQNSVPDSEGRLWGWQGESCTFKTLLRTPVYITWSNAPTCEGTPSTSNSVYDRTGRLWGWSVQDQRSCAFRGSRLQLPGDFAKPVLTWQTAPACKGTPTALNSVKTRAGEIWGYEDGQSCAFRINRNGLNWSTAPKCRALANHYNSVRDSLGRPWGFEEGKSCRF